MRGRYYCENCKKLWNSTYAWEGKWQKCNSCQANIYPTSLKPFMTLGKKRVRQHKSHLCQRCIELGRGCWYSGDRNKKEHLTEYCQKCKELGRNCRTYVPSSEPVDDDEEEDDNISMMSDLFTNTRAFR